MTEKPIEWTDQLEGGIMLKGPSLDRFDVEKFKKNMWNVPHRERKPALLWRHQAGAENHVTVYSKNCNTQIKCYYFLKFHDWI